MTRTITYAQLKTGGACATQLRLFRRLFGKAVIVTEATAVEHAQAFDWAWAANCLLSLPAQQACNEAITTAQQAYREAVAPAQQAYREATAPAQQAYCEARALAWQAYSEATDTAWRAYFEAKATAFARAYNDDDGAEVV